jgi:hypothetical protein
VGVSNPDLRVSISNPDFFWALWLAIHRGDPGPEERTPAAQLTIALSIHELANKLADKAAGREIRAIAAKAMTGISQELAK